MKKVLAWTGLVAAIVLAHSEAGVGILRAQTPLAMEPLQGQWESDAGGWQTRGQRPPAGWYLRSQRQYDIGAFSLQIKKADANDLVFFYLKDWQICLRPDSVTARYAGLITANFRGMTLGRPSGLYWYTATRPLEYQTTEWKAFTINLDGSGIVLSSDGKELVKFSSPEQEWGEKVRSSGRFAAFAPYVYPKELPGYSVQKQVMVVHAYGKGLEVRGLSVNGTDAGEAEGFFSQQGKAKSETIAAEEDLPLHRPSGMLEVNWRLDAAEAARISQFAKCTQWTVPAKDFADTAPDVYKDLVPRTDRQKYPAVMEYRPDAPAAGQLPSTLSLRARYAALPQEARVAFNLAEDGVYTLQLGWGTQGMGWGPNLLEISVDGKPVVLEQYRALMKYYVCSPGMESLPLKLAAGPHRVDFRLVTDRYWHGSNLFFKLLKFPIGSLQLVKGEQIPWKTVDVKRPSEATQQTPATDADFRNGEWNGPELNYRLTGLAAGSPYTVRLFFADFETVEKGSRLMRVSVNGETVEKSLDIFAEKGWGALLEKSYSVAAQPDGNAGGKIEIRIKGLKRKAVVNGLILDGPGGTVVFRENFGWHLFLEQFAQRKRDALVNPKLALPPISAEPPQWTPKDIFDGHNVVANPHFSITDADAGKKPSYWLSFRELADRKTIKKNFVSFYNLFPGSGDYGYDAKVGQAHPGTLRIGRTDDGFGLTCNMVIVDPNKRQRFSYFVKAEKGAAPVRAAIVWLAKNWDSAENGPDFPLPAPVLQVLSTARGEPVAPGDEWREVVVDAKAPAEAAFALLAIDAPGNGASAIWVDDAEFNGYGAEPIEITRSFAGFHPRGDKTMIVKSFRAEPVAWQIKRAGSDQVVASGKIEANRYEWFSKRYYFQLNAASVREPGEYVVTATQGGVSVTDRVKVGADVYRDVALTMMQALHRRRFNGAAENVRDPKLLDYAAAVKVLYDDRFVGAYEPLLDRDRTDLTGGYYDAGDQIVHAEFWPCVVAATLNGVTRAGDDKELLAKSSAEADWILAAFHKYAAGNGSLVISCKPQGYLLDNIPLYSYDPIAGEAYNVTQTAGAAAMGAYALRERDPNLSRRYIAMAEDNYEASRFWEIVNAASEVGPREMSAAAKALWAEMYLNRLSTKHSYSDRMGKSALVLAKGLKSRAYVTLADMVVFGDNGDSGGATQDCVWVPVLFAREYPNHPATPEIKDGLRAFAAHIRQLSSNTIWGQAGALNTPDGQIPARFPDGAGHRRGSYWPMLAYTLSEVGMLLKDEQTILLAERQLQWCLGRNFADLSVVQGIGSRYVMGGNLGYSDDVFFNHWLKSPGQALVIPGGVPSVGFRDVSDGKLWDEATAKGHIPMPYLFPAGYCMMPPRPYYGTMPGRFPHPSEVYLPQVAHYNLAAASVNAALRSLEQEP